MLRNRHTRRLLAFSVAIGGIGLLIGSYHLHAYRLWEFSLSHVGVAALVAGVIGCLYEMGAERERYNQEADALAKMASEIADKKLEGALQHLFPVVLADDKNAKDLFKLHSNMQAHIKLIVQMSRQLEAEGRSSVVLVRFVEKLLGYASGAAATLSPTGGTLQLPKSATLLAAEILSEQMGVMRSGDAYEVISDFATWQNQELDKFRAKISDVASSRVRVRRIFARFDHDSKRMSAADARAILREHWEIASMNRHYELAVSTELAEHVGIFKFGRSPICFRPPEGDLSMMSVKRTDYERFGEFWDRAIKVRRYDGRTRKNERVLSFEELCDELSRSDATWWTRFYGPSVRVKTNA